MANLRRKLLILDGARDSVEHVSEELKNAFDVRSVAPADLKIDDILADTDLILARPEDFASATSGGLDMPGAQQLLEALRAGVALLSSKGEVLWSNPAFDALSPDMLRRIGDMSRRHEARFGNQAGDSRHVWEIEPPDDDRIFELQLAGSRADSTDPDAPRRYTVVVRDITAQHSLRRRINGIDRAGSELIDLDADEVRRLNGMERLKLIEQKIVRICHKLLHFDHFAIWMLDPRSDRLEPVITSGLPAEVAELEIYASEKDSGITGRVVATGEGYLCPDTAADKHFLPGLAEARSSLTVPLRLHDKIIGALDIESEKVNAFDEDDRQLAEILARYIAMAMHMLDLLVVERCTTNEVISGRVEGELDEPLADILAETDVLERLAKHDPEVAEHLEKIKLDVQSIRNRVKSVTAGPQTLLDAERALSDRTEDPLLRSKRVLVADDGDKVRRIIRDVLRNRGCRVEVAESGSQAISAVEDAAAAKDPFDLIVTDIQMPDRNGYEVFSASRKITPGIHVILMTGFGYDPHHSIVRASQEGLERVLFKPFPVERLLDEVRQALTGTTSK